METLKQIAAGHHALYDNCDRLSNREVAAQIKRYTKRIQAARMPSDAAAPAPLNHKTTPANYTDEKKPASQ